MKVITPFGRGRESKVKLTVAKDRPGHVRGFAVERKDAAVIRLISDEDVTVRVVVEPPDAAAPPAFRPTTLMEKISKAVEAEPGLTTNGVIEAVGGKKDAKREALRLLVDEGYIEQRRDGQAVRHHPLREYRAANDEGQPSPWVPTGSRRGCWPPGPRVPPYGARDPGPSRREGPTESLDPTEAGGVADPDIDRAERLAADYAADLDTGTASAGSIVDGDLDAQRLPDRPRDAGARS